jgi:hypothetical protein
MAAVADPTEASAQPGAGDLPLPFRSYGRPDTVCAPARGGNHGPGLATHTRISGAHDRFPNTTNLRGARPGVSITEGHEAVVSRASLS